jgi:DNA-binding NarL/FixJ family response regulator
MHLSRKERVILSLVCKGLRNSEIASLVGVTERTVKWHMSRLFQQFEVTNRTELAGHVAANETEVSTPQAPPRE